MAKLRLVDAWILLPAAIYFVLVDRYAVDIPMKDDYDAILAFLFDFGGAPSFADRAILLFSEHTDHRILSTRSISVLYCSLFGGVNFRHLIFLANLQLLLAFAVVVSFIRKFLPRHWAIASFVFGLCLFDPSSYENATFALAGLQNHGVLALFLASLFCYGLDDRRALVPAALLQIACTFSSANGMLGALFLAGFALSSRDRWKIGVSVASLLLFAPLYFLHRSAPPRPVMGPGISVPYALQMSGAHFSFDHALWVGAVLWAVLLLALPVRGRRIDTAALPLVALLGFVLSTLITISLFRSDTQPFFSSRYLSYSHLLVGLAFLFSFRRLQGTRAMWPVAAALGAALLAAYVANYRYGTFALEREKYLLEERNYYYPDRTRAEAIAWNACQAGIYCRPEER